MAKLYRQCKELCGCIMSEKFIMIDHFGRECCTICGVPLTDTPRPLAELDLKGWEEVKDLKIDIKFVDGSPDRYKYFNSYNVYYPIEL